MPADYAALEAHGPEKHEPWCRAQTCVWHMARTCAEALAIEREINRAGGHIRANGDAWYPVKP